MTGGGKRLQSLGSPVIVATFMTGLWLLGVFVLMLVSTYSGTGDAVNAAGYRHQATGTTYAYQDATGKFTVYIRGSRRTPFPEPYEAEV